MVKHLNLKWLFGLAGAVLLILTRDAYAYIDPGAGSYVLQLLLAALVGALYAIKVYWGRIKSFFSKDKEVQDDRE